MANEYDDLMKQAKEKLEYQKNGTINNENNEQEDIYASLKEEAEQDDNAKPELKSDYQNNNKPELPNEDIFKEEYYIDPNDSPIFDGGPGISNVQLWKKQYGITKVFHTKVLEKHFLFRTLNRSEYEQIASMSLDSLTNEELICKTCVLWPLNYNYDFMSKEDAGYPSTLAKIIMEYSGFTDEYGIEVL